MVKPTIEHGRISGKDEMKLYLRRYNTLAQQSKQAQ